MPAKDTKFPTWDELVEDAVVDLPPYQLPLGTVERTVERLVDGKTVAEKITETDVVVEIPCPSGEQYLRILEGRRVGDASYILNALIEDDESLKRVIAKMKGAPFHIVDVLNSKVIRYYYGLSIEREEREGNSQGS